MCGYVCMSMIWFSDDNKMTTIYHYAKDLNTNFCSECHIQIWISFNGILFIATKPWLIVMFRPNPFVTNVNMETFELLICIVWGLTRVKMVCYEFHSYMLISQICTDYFKFKNFRIKFENNTGQHFFTFFLLSKLWYMYLTNLEY